MGPSGFPLEALDALLGEPTRGAIEKASPLLKGLARRLPALWGELPPEAKERLYALALALPPLPEGHPALAFAEAVLDLVEREDPAHASLLASALEGALEGKGKPLWASRLGQVLGLSTEEEA